MSKDTKPPPPEKGTQHATGNGLILPYPKEYSQESTWSPTLEKTYEISSIEMAELKRQTNLIGSNVVRLKAMITVLEDDNVMDIEL
jgi:hypothetical protein